MKLISGPTSMRALMSGRGAVTRPAAAARRTIASARWSNCAGSASRMRSRNSGMRIPSPITRRSSARESGRIRPEVMPWAKASTACRNSSRVAGGWPDGPGRSWALTSSVITSASRSTLLGK